MYTLLTLFFLSLTCIVFMIGRKLALVRGGHIVEENRPHPLTPDLRKAKHFTFWSIKMVLDIIILIILKIYVKSSNFFKNQHRKVQMGIRALKQKNQNNILLNKEHNKFLKVMSDYKAKISAMKHKIHEEEKNQ